MSSIRIRVAVIFGGRSNEHAVSCVSAGFVLRNLDPERYEAVPIGITREGTWVLSGSDARALAIADRALPSVDGSGTELVLAVDPTRGGSLLPLDGGDGPGAIEVVFPTLHGAFGEDGTVQGLLEMAGLPYVGPGVLASATGMDKEFMKKLFAAEGIPVGDHVVLRPGTATVGEADRARLGLPVFVKPARGGSSIGITRVGSWDRLDDAIAVARAHDPKVIVEAAIVGREIECGVLELPDGRVEASALAEIRMPDEADSRAPDFYDFDTKYLDDVCEFDIPAKLNDDVTQQVRELAVRTFRALDCQGLARVDFFITEHGPVVNEINTMPGLTSISMYPRMWEATGIDNGELITALVETAVARGTGLR
jgi:D-alanine-D-alanine ligase